MGKATAMDPERRRWLRAGSGPHPAAPRLPWADLSRLFSQCTRCGACRLACPEGIVVAGDGGFPGIDFARGGCTFCGACAAACAAGVFEPGRPVAWHARVRIGERCITRQGVYCQSCRDACEPRAIGFTPVPGAVPHPRLDRRACTACGACTAACPVGAITWVDADPGAGT